MALDMREGPEQGPAERLGCFKETVMGGVLAGVVPYSFSGVEFRPVRRQLEDLDMAPVLGKPVIGFALLVIRGVVLNQIDAMTASVKGRQ